MKLIIAFTLAIALPVVLVIIALATGFLQMHGWDWTLGTDTHYFIVYLPHGDILHYQAGH